MNIITYNVRGLRRGVKWAAIRRMVKKEQIDLLCIQETKKERIEKTMCQALWGNSEVSWEMQPACNTGGGLLCLWSEKTFTLERKVNGSGFILLEGVWVQDAQKVIIVSIYSPCDIYQKRVLWDIVRQMKNSNSGGLWCILGDFNNIRRPTERMGVCHRGMDDRTMKEFNDWIADLEVEEVSCVGRKFTWYRPNESAKSKLDRVLISADTIYFGLELLRSLPPFC